MLSPLFQIAIISIASFASQWIAWRLKIPAIVFLLSVGFVVGPMTGWVVPQELVGDLLSPVVGIAVAIILFEGSLQLRFSEIKEVRRTVVHVVIAGLTVGWGLMAFAAHYIGGLSWPVALTFAGLLVVTGPTVIIPLLRHSKINSRTGSILKWEGIINDPLGVILAVLCYEYFFHAELTGDIGSGFYLEMGVLLFMIAGGSYLLGWLAATILERGLVPEYLKAPFMVCLVIVSFVACNSILHESGLIAVTVLGMTLTNKHLASIEEIRKFKENISTLLIAGVFILLTANLSPSVLLSLDVQGVLFVLLVVFLIRPLTIFAASFGTKMTQKETLLIGWIAPRGIVCAAVAGVLGPLLVDAGFEDGEKLLPLAFLLVLITVLLHGLTARPLAKHLGLGASHGSGLLIVGANPWTTQLAEMLRQRNVPVMIADKNWYDLKRARLSGIPVYYGEILSEGAEYEVEFNQYGTLLAATDGHEYNTLVCNDFSAEFGKERVFQVPDIEDHKQEEHKIPSTLRGRYFLGKHFDFYTLGHHFAEGWRFSISRLGDEDKMDKSEQAPKEEALLVGMIHKNGDMALTSNHDSLKVKPQEGDLKIVFAKKDAS